jgi:uncharacterized membrane protein
MRTHHHDQGPINMNVRDQTTASTSQGSFAASGQQSSLQGTARRATRRVERKVLEKVDAERLARGLGWFSVGLGMAELLMPGAVARIAGGRGKHTGLLRLYGLREIASGLMIFSQGRRPAAGVWSRVAGDAVDLATLGLAFLTPSTNKAGVTFAAANVLGVTALDVICAQQLSREAGKMTDDGAIRTRRSISINRPREEVYRYWRDFQNLPRFMYHLESVQVLDERRSHWIAKAPAGKRVEWDSEITAERPDEMIAWRSLEGADVYNAGSVEFESRPGGRGTIVRVEVEYRPPGGVAGTAFAMLFNESPEQQIYDDLRRFKQMLEIGEIVRSDASQEGTGGMKPHPARPA